MTKHPGGPIGQRLLPVIIDEVAATDPQRSWAALPVDDYDLEQGFENISFEAFANAINKLARCIVQGFGRSESFATIAYFGTPDIRYYMLLFAVCKSGHKVLFSSHLNSLETHMSLMDETKCEGMLVARGVYVDDILTERPMPKVEIPELDDLLDLSVKAEPMPYTKTFEEAKRDPIVICHTSGTTGSPRPVTFTHAGMAAMDNQTELPDVDGRSHWTLQCDVGTRYLMVASPFHPIAAVLAMTVCGFGGGTLIPGFRHRLVEIGDLCDIIESSQATTGFVPFIFMDIIARKPDAERYIKCFKSLTYGNGILSDYAGDVWSKHGVRFQDLWGTSETLTPPVLIADQEDYQYVYFDVDAAGIEFRQYDLEYIDTNGAKLPVYEMVMTFTPQSEKCAGYWANMGITEAPSEPPYPEYALDELWTPHPDPKKARYAWRFLGRMGDFVAENTSVGLAMERALGQDKRVQNAIVLRRYDEAPAALIELADDITPDTAGNLWEDVIEPENQKLAEDARIPKSHVILVDNKEFVRGSEGHLLRSQTEQKFDHLIDEVAYLRCKRRTVVAERPRYESIIETVEVVEVVETVEGFSISE